MSNAPVPWVNLGDLAKPATVLIEKLSDAIGGLCKPGQIIRLAKAEAEAARIQAGSEIEITEMHRRAMYRLLGEEARKQANIENITRKALPWLDEQAAPERMDDDWITHFFDKCRIVSNEDMQRLWAKVLAGEANAPGSFSRKTVNLIADLNASDGKLFTQLCCFCWVIGRGPVPLIFGFGDHHQPGFSKEDGAIYHRHGIHFDTVRHLEALGLVQVGAGNYSISFAGKSLDVFYFGKKLSIDFHPVLEGVLPTGHVLLTRAGEELAPHCGSWPIDGFFELVRDKWPQTAIVTHSAFTIRPDQNVPPDSQPSN